MTDQTKAPERIWVEDTAQGTERPNGVWDSWSHPSLVEFIRADLAAEQVKQAYERGIEAAAADQLTDALGNIAVMGYSEDAAVAKNIARAAVDMARSARKDHFANALAPQSEDDPVREAAVSEAVWQDVTALPDPKEGPFMVSNLPNAVNSHGRPSHVFCVGSIHKDEDGSFCAFDGHKKIWGITRYYPISSPALPQEAANE